jgi:hypothetical protein
MQYIMYIATKGGTFPGFCKAGRKFHRMADIEQRCFQTSQKQKLPSFARFLISSAILEIISGVALALLKRWRLMTGQNL